MSSHPPAPVNAAYPFPCMCSVSAPRTCTSSPLRPVISGHVVAVGCPQVPGTGVGFIPS